MRLKDKVAIVAGAAWGGIGAASALRFAQEGAHLVINTRNRAEKLEETADYIRAAGGRVVTVMGDVAAAHLARPGTHAQPDGPFASR